MLVAKRSNTPAMVEVVRCGRALVSWLFFPSSESFSAALFCFTTGLGLSQSLINVRLSSNVLPRVRIFLRGSAPMTGNGLACRAVRT